MPTVDHVPNSPPSGASSDPEVPERARKRTFSAAYKLRILQEYDGLDRLGKGALLRREGLYTSLLSEWRRQRDQGALQGLAKKKGRPSGDPKDREIGRLRRERDRALAELAKARKVVDIQGKLYALLEGLGTESANQDSEHRR